MKEGREPLRVSDDITDKNDIEKNNEFLALGIEKVNQMIKDAKGEFVGLNEDFFNSTAINDKKRWRGYYC